MPAVKANPKRKDEFEVTVRSTPQDEVDRYGMSHAVSPFDGACAVLVNDEIVAFGNEYGTAFLVAGTNATPTQEEVEAFIVAAVDFYAEIPGTLRRD